MSKFKDEDLISLWEQNLTDQQIAEKFGVCKPTIWYARKRLGLKTKKKYEKLKVPENLTKDQEAVVLGSFLGKGTLEKRNNSYQFYFCSSKKQKGIYELKKKPFIGFINEHTSRYTYSFRTVPHPGLQFFYEVLHKDSEKFFPNLLLSKLSLETLSYWALDSFNFSEDYIGLDTKTRFESPKELIKYLWEWLKLKAYFDQDTIKILNFEPLLKIIREKYPNIPDFEPNIVFSKADVIYIGDSYGIEERRCIKCKNTITVPWTSRQSLCGGNACNKREIGSKLYDLSYPTETIIGHLYEDDFPYFPYDITAFKNEIRNLSRNKPKVQNKKINHTTAFMRTPNYFMWHRYEYNSRNNSFTAFEWFYREEKLEQLIDKLKKRGFKTLSTAKLRQVLKERGETPGNFSPTAAKYIFNTYKSNANHPIILDPCAGFGGRLFGAWCTKGPLTYIGIEPNTETYNGLVKFKDWLTEQWDELAEPNEIRLIHSPMEDVDYSEYAGKVDLIFTSPPYFDTEKYGEEETQSYMRYPEYEEWKESFLEMFPKIAKTVLKDTGIISINLKDKGEYHIYSDLCALMDQYGFEKADELKLNMGVPAFKRTEGVKENFEMIGFWRKK